MLRWRSPHISATALVALTVVIIVPAGGAQQPAPTLGLPDTPQVLSTTAGRVRVVPIKGLVYPWALAFLPNGDMLVTEHSRTKLRLIHGDILDPSPITGLPPGFESQRRDTAGVDVTLHPHFHVLPPCLGFLFGDRQRFIQREATGISLGGITTYFASFGLPTRDPRIKASAPIAPGDPPYASLSFALGFDGVVPAPVSTPALLLVGDADVFEAATGGSAAAYARLHAPKYQVMISDAPHVWFGNGDHVPPDDLNPDCIWFEENSGTRPPMCAERRPLIDPARQKQIARHALLAFFDAYLKDDPDAHARLGAIGETFAEVTLRQELSSP